MSVNDKEQFERFLDFIKNGYVSQVEKMLKNKDSININPSAEDNKAIKAAIIIGHNDIVELLLNDSSVQNSVKYEELKKFTDDKEITELLDYFSALNSDSESEIEPIEKKKTPEPKKSEEELFNDFLNYVKHSNVEEVKKMVKEGQVDPSMSNNRAMEIAADYGRDEIIEFLLMDPRVATTVDHYQMEEIAYYNKNWSSVKLIGELTDYNEKNPERVKELEDFKQGKLKGELKELKKEPVNFNDLLKYIQDGNLRAVKNILDEGRVDPSEEDNKAIKKATELGYVEIIKTLLSNDRIMNTIDYDQLIKMSLDKGNKRIAEVIGNIARKNTKTKRRMSIPEYKTIRKVVKPAELAPEIEFDDFDKELKNVDIVPSLIPDIKKSFKDAFVPIITNAKKDDLVSENNKFKSFLCEMETFAWSSNERAEDYLTHKNRINIAYNGIYPTYTIHLVKMLGNDITLFTMNTISSTKSDYLSNHSLRRFKITPNDLGPDYDNSKHRIFNFPKPLELAPRSLVDALSDNNLPNYQLFSPLFFREFKKSVPERFLYTCHYCEEIKSKNTRYSLVNCIYMYIHGGVHYTFLFIDHKDKILEYYDPEIFENKKTGILFTYKALQTIFPGYKINRFWRLSSIQKTEQFEKDEKGFCVKWGHMILQLKLLNINMTVGEIEASLIRECESKNLSLYELVLNYTYLMKRVIPSDMNKMLKLKKLLM